MLNSKKVATLFAASALALTIGLVGCGNNAQPQQTTTETTTEATTEATTQTTTEAAKPEATTTQTEAAPQATTEEAKPQATTQTTEAPVATSNPADAYIGNEQATNIALADAGFAASDVYDLDCELDLDDAVVHYDVDFQANGMEYDYDIDAVSGAIIYSQAEVDD